MLPDISHTYFYTNISLNNAAQDSSVLWFDKWRLLFVYM